jgi:hypothetical protein
MTGMFAACASSTPLAMALPSCGTITSTSTWLVMSDSMSLTCALSSLFADSTVTVAPSSRARF